MQAFQCYSSASSDDEEEDKQKKQSSSSTSTTSSSTTATTSTTTTTATAPVRPAFPLLSSSASSSTSTSLVAINSTPDVDVLPYDDSHHHYVAASARTLSFNPTVDEMWKPIAGPQQSSSSSSSSTSTTLVKNHVCGYVEPSAYDNAVFDQHFHNFVSKGYTIDPAQPHLTHHPSAALVRDTSRSSSSASSDITPKEKEILRLKRKIASDVSDVDGFLGPWASRLTAAQAAPQAITDEQRRNAEEVAAKKRLKQAAKEEAAAVAAGGSAGGAAVDAPATETSTFHGTELYDYQHRSYVDAPPHCKVVDWESTPNTRCYQPNTVVHTWQGHKKGVNCIRFMPRTAHLLLSASMDKTIKIWNVGGDYKCMRTYAGHSEAVRDICFNHDGRRFMSCSYDKFVKLWDTETGQCISRHTTGKVPYCVRLHPSAESDHEALVGQQNKMIVQWDTRANQVSVEYNDHLGAVNSVTFIDGNRRFVSTSDDKKVFVWEYGIPVVVKHLSEPDMHSMPAVGVHPSGKYFVGQSQDNQILVFTAINRYKLKRDKRFVGHLSAGYACEIGFSPDGQYIMSGDGQGRVFIWDWATSRLLKKFKAHDQVTLGCAWNPNEASNIATCSWDGTIKYWH